MALGHWLKDYIGPHSGGSGGSGGGTALKVSIAETDGSAYYRYDKTWQEVHDAIARGEYVTYEYVSNDSGHLWLRIVRADEDEGDYFIIAEDVENNNGYFRCGQITFNEMGSPNEYLSIGRSIG